MPEITITTGTMLFEFTTFGAWVGKAASWYRNAGVRIDNTIAVDAVGRVCVSGSEMMRARDEDTFPVRVYRI